MRRQKKTAYLQLHVLWERSNPLIDTSADLLDLDLQNAFTGYHGDHMQVLGNYRGRRNPIDFIPPGDCGLDVQLFNTILLVDSPAHRTVQGSTLLETTENDGRCLGMSHYGERDPR